MRVWNIVRNSAFCNGMRTFRFIYHSGLIQTGAAHHSSEKKAVKQRRDGIADDVYRAMCDVVHMNKQHNEETQFVMDFSEDYLDRKAAETLSGDDESAA